MDKSCVYLISVLLISLVITGCANSPPQPPEQLHAVFSRKPRTSLSIQEPYDTIIMASVDSNEEYAKKRKGDWITTWYLCKLNVLQVLAGEIPESTLNVRNAAAFPTPESGILLSIDPGPLQPGNLVAFWLDTRVKPYTIVFCQTRTPREEWCNIPAHANLQITRAIETRLRYCPSYLEYLGQTDTSHVVSDGPRTFSVDKTTWIARKYTGDQFEDK